ncbi:3640_t:CDS:2 [Ambispora leptoticha]|uniref:3640_t:CDS:1 n=1 Tax=Ambispora leptoticha TaxID=144679 RepID=A0A9N9AAV0_9GLOM|nr:3640_t:CDS:2 [Ambispora leptoticha]
MLSISFVPDGYLIILYPAAIKNVSNHDPRDHTSESRITGEESQLTLIQKTWVFWWGKSDDLGFIQRWWNKDGKIMTIV